MYEPCRSDAISAALTISVICATCALVIIVAVLVFRR